MEAEEDYGVIRNSLVDDLKAILDEYPDDGQILKELIQNAEDAGATEVKFLYDENSYPTDKLHHPGMAQFQGAAFYAYNNAQFAEADWKGIRMLRDSIKKDDAMKVGRFGLGFKSVLHMTDLPSVLSGDRLYMIDPHEEYFLFQGRRTSGYLWNLKTKQDLIKNCEDQFKPYHNIFNCNQDTFDRGYYEGTLFRFPLRQVKSALSDTVYDAECMDVLQESFEVDAHMVHLFLKKLENIKLYKKSKGQGHSELTLEVKISDDCLKEVRQKRQHFQAKSTEIITYLIRVEVLKYSDGIATSSAYQWLVTEYHAGSSLSTNLRKLANDPSLGLRPLVGVAMEIKNSAEEIAGPDGQVFCFLPLPKEQTTSTGLSVHINGFFAVSQNRRHLKWPVAGRSSKSDKPVLWNQCLLNELVPTAYLHLLMNAVKQSKALGISPVDIYGALPDQNAIDEKWKPVAQEVYGNILSEKIFYTEANRGAWNTCGNVIFDCLTEDSAVRDIVVKTLLQCNCNVATDVPKHVIQALEEYHGYVTKITPSLVRQELKKNPRSYQHLAWSDKLLLLKYIVTVHHPEEYHELTGIELLPCSNKQMRQFSRYGSKVYISSSNIPLDLFPGQESNLLATADCDDLGITNTLKKMTDADVCQLEVMTHESARELIRQVLPSWKTTEPVTFHYKDSRIPLAWFDHLWTYLMKFFPHDISLFEGLHIVKNCANEQYPLKLYPLSKSNLIIVKEAQGHLLSEPLERVLEICGVTILNRLTDSMQSHPTVFRSYVKVPTDENIINLMCTALQKNNPKYATKKIGKLAINDKEVLLDIIYRASAAVTRSHVDILRMLPIFPSSQIPKYVSVADVDLGADISNLPCNLSRPVIDLSRSRTRQAAQVLQVEVVSQKDLLEKYVFPDINKGFHDQTVVQNVMTFVFDQCSQYFTDGHFLSAMGSLPFVKCGEASTKRPRELFDPNDTILQDLLVGKSNVFPTDDYKSANRVEILKKMGLKTSQSLTGDAILEIMRDTDAMSSSDNAVRKGKALLLVLENNTILLDEYIGGVTLHTLSSKLAWVPVVQDKTSTYPGSLLWKASSSCTEKPTAVTSSTWHQLIGSTMAVVDVQSDSLLANRFKWNKKPKLNSILKHLKNIVESYDLKDKALYMIVLYNVYDHLAQLNPASLTQGLQEENMTEWVWHGEGFSDLAHMVEYPPSINLVPYVRTLPNDLKQYQKMFLNQGMDSCCSNRKMIQVLHQMGLETTLNLQQVIGILNFLKLQSLEETERQDLLMPVITESGTTDLVDINLCTYSDEDGWGHLDNEDKNEKLNLIHRDVTMDTAKRLGVPSLLSRILHTDDFPISGYGQGEPLTTRLHNLLDDYSDGLAIFKEMIQNADDAGATTVSFLYDERENHQNKTRLIDPQMKDFQGSALWVHNNATFSDKDFENIIKLGGATKENDADKIGKFGVGFNAVYNVTDLPSFISQHYVVFFDPHAKYLGKALKHHNQPGIKIDLHKKSSVLQNLSDQFYPFNGIFDCKLNNKTFYDGTLFRLPLRSRKQAAESEISEKYYSPSEMKALFKLLVENANPLLLFTHKVCEVKFYHLASDAPLADMKLVFTLKKQEKQNPMLSSNVIESSVVSTLAAEDVECSQSSIIETFTNLQPAGSSLCVGMKEQEKTSHWLVSCYVDTLPTQTKLKFSSIQQKLIGGVAFLLNALNDDFVPLTMNEHEMSLAFCFLPLPIVTNLPVQINGTFAVTSNRKHLQEKTHDSKDDTKAKWNEILLGGAIVKAYRQGLNDLVNLLPKESDVQVFNLWPTSSTVSRQFDILVKSFFKSTKVNSIPFSHHEGKTTTLENIIFFDTENMPAGLASKATSAFASIKKGYHIVAPPAQFIECLQRIGHDKMVKKKYFDQSRFFHEIFFPNMHKLDRDQRDDLIIFVIQQDAKDLNELIKMYPCIPVTPKGEEVKKAQELFHPKGSVAKLYTDADGRFPVASFARSGVIERLQALGLQTDDLSWEDIVERAKSVKKEFEQRRDIGTQRSECLLHFMDKKLTNHKHNEKTKSDLRQIPFLMPKKAPKSFPIPWRDVKKTDIFCAEDLYSPTQADLVSATMPVAEVNAMTDRVKVFLDFKKDVPFHVVENQLDGLLSIEPANLPDDQLNVLRRTLQSIYVHLNTLCINKTDLNRICDLGRNKSCILVGRHFVSPHRIAFHLSYDCSPFLYALPSEFKLFSKAAMAQLGVKKAFEAHDFIRTLQGLNELRQGCPLDENEQKVAVHITGFLNKTMMDNNWTLEQVQGEHGLVFIPNSKGILCEPRTLCYDDCPWIKKDDMDFIHPNISYLNSSCLQIKTKKQKVLQPHAQGIPFGQHERLLVSLKRIVNNFPSQFDVLKELIQNADDSGATQIHFICDRQNHGKRVFDKCWEPLQGPALCVYNNQPFTEDDLVGIQRLGEGSKKTEAHKTGQYGIGFSSVYHLTDVPSILTSSKELSKTLCVFDPHYKYVPEASECVPGMRYKCTTDMEASFPDVFSCYHQDRINIENGSMIRLPLRTGKMADESKISNEKINVSKIQELLGQLEQNAFNMLLFLNNLEEIKISDIDELGNFGQTYVAKLELSQDEQMVRNQIKDLNLRMSKEVKSGSFCLDKTPQRQFIYKLIMSDSQQRRQDWLVCQTLGIPSGYEVPETIQDAYQNENLVLLPRGAVACCTHCTHSSLKQTFHGKTYSFLPLESKTTLPVNINAHFALDNENRGHVWGKKDVESVKKDWNTLLCSTVLPQSYCSLLEETKVVFIKKKNDKLDASPEHQHESIIKNCVKIFLGTLPSGTYQEWHVLLKNVLHCIVERNIKIFPIVKCAQGNAMKSTIEWLPSKGEQRAFFWNLPSETSSVVSGLKSQIRNLKLILVDCGMNIIDISLGLQRTLESFEVNVSFVEPLHVLEHFSDSRSHNLGTLPLPLSKTPLKRQEELFEVLSFCQKDEQFLTKLHGLSLLLTQDNVLRVFDKDNPIFEPTLIDLVKDRKELFASSNMWVKVFKNNKDVLTFDENCVFRQLNFETLADILKNDENFKRSDQAVQWTRDQTNMPTKGWMQQFWGFVDSVKHPDSKTKRSKLSFHSSSETLLEPLKELCLIPAVKSSEPKYVLYPISRAKDVYFHTSANMSETPLKRILEKLGVPELDILGINYNQSLRNPNANLLVIKDLVASLDKPDAVLKLVHNARDIMTDSENFDLKSCRALLQYFEKHINKLKNDSLDILLIDLPLYINASGNAIALTGCRAYTIPDDMPLDGLECFRRSDGGVVFLKRDESLERLYDYLGCHDYDVADMYCQFVFQHFEMFTEAEQSAHLTFIYEKYIQDDKRRVTAEKKKILDGLRNLNFLKDSSDNLKKASEFFDPNITLFKMMLSKECFPPESKGKFTKDSWYGFLKILGMVTEVTDTVFIQFAQDIERLGQTSATSNVQIQTPIRQKSQTLVLYLFQMESDQRKRIMPQIKTIRFLLQYNADYKLRELCPQNGQDLGPMMAFNESVSQRHQHLVWTKANLLSSDVDPSSSQRLDSEEKKRAQNMLGILTDPPEHVVISHLETICTHCQGIKDDQKKTLITVLQNIFTHLHKQQHLESLPRLKEMPIIPINNYDQFVKCNQVVVNIADEDELPPYLYRYPVELGPFIGLFEQIGVTDMPTPDQYVDVLANFHRESDNQPLNAKITSMVHKATKCLFDLFKKDRKACLRSLSMYLLDQNGKLVDVRDLVFNDSTALQHRLTYLKLRYMFDTRKCGLSNQLVLDTFNKFPEHLRPRMLSDLFEEKLFTLENDEVGTCDVSDYLERRIQNEAFGFAVRRLINHEVRRNGEDINDVDIWKILEHLSTTSVRCVDNVITELTRNKKPIQDTKMAKACCVVKELVQSPNIWKWTIFIKTDSLLDIDLLVPFCDILDGILASKLGRSLMYLMPLLKCTSEEDLEKKLNEFNISDG